MFQSYFTFYIQLVLIQKYVALPIISVLDLQYLRVDSLTPSFLKLCTYQFLFSHRTAVKFTLILCKTRFHFRWIPFIFLPFSQDYYLLVHRLCAGPGRHGGQRHRRHHWHRRGRKAGQHDLSRVGLRQKLFAFFFFCLFTVFRHSVLLICTFAFTSSTLSMVGLFLIALGTGGIKPCVAAFGGDQFDENQVRSLPRCLTSSLLDLHRKKNTRCWLNFQRWWRIVALQFASSVKNGFWIERTISFSMYMLSI